MAKKRYIKDSKGTTVSVTTDTLGLEKPLLNENYDIDVHNRNMDKIDEDLKPIDDSYIIELFQHDGDTTNPRDYYTKVEADEKFASKEEVENIDLSNLATKEETNNALNKANEAFQRGDNVKTQLVDKLISEGLNVSTNNTFEELINGIALGKKWASGVTTSSSSQKSFSRNNNTPGNLSAYSLEVFNLGFNPSFIYIYDENFAKKVHLNNATDGTQTTYFEYEGNQSAYYKNTSSASILPFWINVEGTVGHTKNGFCLPVYNASRQYAWIAYE